MHSIRKVDKVELYVIWWKGKFMFEAGRGKYFTWNRLLPHGCRTACGRSISLHGMGRNVSSYDITSLTAGVSTLTVWNCNWDVRISHYEPRKLRPLWYGEIIDIEFTGAVSRRVDKSHKRHRLRWILFQGYSDDDWALNMKMIMIMKLSIKWLSELR